MIRFAFFLLLALALVAALFYVDTALGWIDIGLGGNVYEVRSGFLIVGVMLVSLALVLVWRLAAVIWSAPARSRRALAHARNARGAEGVETALIALAAGDAAHARQAAIKARKQLDNPLAARVLAAQAAEAMKDRPTAEAEFASLLESEKAQVAARRGLAAAAAEKGDTAAVIAHAKFAFEANPAAKWAFEALFDAQVSGAAWEEALASLTSGEKHGHIAHDAAKRRRAVLYAAQAAREEDLAEMDKALMAAEKSTQDAPGFAPGAALAARLFMMHNKGWRAAGVLENAWETAPHPAIALAYRDLKENEAVKARVKRMMGLVQIQPEHRESRILAAELHLLAGEGPAAQLVLDKVLKREEPSARLCGLAAQVAQATGDLAAAHEWMQRARAARREPDWSDVDPEGPAYD
ncbi:MAG: heme biosynthesis HemY N-terminal domain-containing protein, partial [Maricaulaceae bacterium]